MNIYKYLILLCFLFSGLHGCSLLNAQKRDAPTVFDLGPQRVYPANPQPVETTFLISPVSASAWLDNPGIQYRLTYQDASRPEAYAQNRWVTTPAQLLTERVRARFAAASRGVVTAQDGARADYALRIELEDFSQSFNTADSSKAVVRLRASLIDLTTRALHAQQSFSAEQSAAPDAPGAAQSLAAASEAVIEDLFRWVAQRVKP